MPRLRLTLPAKKDIAGLLDWSADTFGAAGRRRYEALLDAALRDIATDPWRAGSREEPQLGPGLRVYHIRRSRDRARGRGGVVRSPRHIVVYRFLQEEGIVIVLRVLHDAMDLARHMRRAASDRSGRDQ